MSYRRCVWLLTRSPYTMSNCVKFLTFLLLGVASTSQASNSRVDDEMLARHSHVKFVADACAVDITNLENWKRVQHSPAFFWYTAQVALHGEPTAQKKQSIKQALVCDAPSGIYVDEVKVRALKS